MVETREVLNLTVGCEPVVISSATGSNTKKRKTKSNLLSPSSGSVKHHRESCVINSKDTPLEKLAEYAVSHIGKTGKINQTAVRRLFVKPKDGFGNVDICLGSTEKGVYFVRGGHHFSTKIYGDNALLLLPWVLCLVRGTQSLHGSWSYEATRLHDAMKSICNTRTKKPMPPAIPLLECFDGVEFKAVSS